MQAVDLEEEKTEVILANRQTIDVLDRQQFVNQLISVTNTLAANKKNACYAVNGEWGVGKSFVLEAFEKQIAVYQQDAPETNKYIVFHYDCWQYDYYEEPLIAVVAVLLDQIDKQDRLIPEEKREKIKAALKIIGASLWGKAKDLLKEKTGFDIAQITELFTSTKEKSEEQISKAHKFDEYFDFKTVLLQLSQLLDDIAKDQTIIFVVDELDRCLPEYTVKVLERLHHVFNGIKNIQVVLAVDKNQLENTIRQIYGDKVSVDHYLAKFIDFELKLSTAKVENIIDELYPDYIDSFKIEYTEKSEINQVCQILLAGLDIRKAKAIVEKSQLCHKLLNDDTEEQDRAVLCLEVFLTLLHSYKLDIDKAKETFGYSDPLNEVDLLSQYMFYEDVSLWVGLPILSNIYRKGIGRQLYFDNRHQGDIYIFTGNVLGLLLGCYRVILDYENDLWLGQSPIGSCLGEIYPEKYLKSYTKKFWQFIQIIE